MSSERSLTLRAAKGPGTSIPMNGSWQGWCRPIAAVLFLGWTCISVAKPPPVKVHDDKVSLKAENANLKELLAAVAKASGAELAGSIPADRTVTVELSSVPMKEAMERLLGNQNFTLTYAGQTLKVIQLKADAEELRVPTTPNQAKGPDSASDWAPAGWWKMSRAFDGKQIPVDGTARAFSEGPTVTWDWLIQSAYAGVPELRRDLIRRGVKAFEEDKELRDAVEAATAGMRDDDIARFVRAFCRDRGVRFVHAIARTTTDPVLRARASAVANRIRAIDRSGEPMPFGKMPPQSQIH